MVLSSLFTKKSPSVHLKYLRNQVSQVLQLQHHLVGISRLYKIVSQVRILTDHVNVAPHRAFKKDWFLRNDAKTGSQIVKSESRDVDTMNNNTSSSRFLKIYWVHEHEEFELCYTATGSKNYYRRLYEFPTLGTII
ncbi:hypothetical protein CTI12_AA379310 [Artemisia annua]|uniref:Uncharacterized protein n=1 Tax=Artemisia annua TaxID=35608 RepID=A0A2U1MH96_ARTAN|nr:hypothetical protein CTI12_AA379310 [Artemisia annua]